MKLIHALIIIPNRVNGHQCFLTCLVRVFNRKAVSGIVWSLNLAVEHLRLHASNWSSYA